jgi:hypothetical protein
VAKNGSNADFLSSWDRARIAFLIYLLENGNSATMCIDASFLDVQLSNHELASSDFIKAQVHVLSKQQKVTPIFNQPRFLLLEIMIDKTMHMDKNIEQHPTSKKE